MLRFENIKIQSTKAVTYFDYGIDDYNPNKSAWQEGTTIDNHVKGKFSQGSKKRFSELIVNWISVIDSKEFIAGYTRARYYKYLVFVTLTLSAKQMHSDKEIRRNMLGSFLKSIKVKHNVSTYLYCSEAQKNGNIHFHIVLNRKIHHTQIRNIWNSIQATHGYIDLFEKVHGHRNPNSTDIHAFRKIKSVAAYLIKYFTKTENRRLIEGRLWGSSENIKLIEPYRTDVCNGIGQLLNRIVENRKAFIFKHDFFTIFRSLKFEDIYNYDSDICDAITKHYSDQYYLID